MAFNLQLMRLLQLKNLGTHALIYHTFTLFLLVAYGFNKSWMCSRNPFNENFLEMDSNYPPFTLSCKLQSSEIIRGMPCLG